ncbi:MAG: hypothetical protein ACI80I_002876, partial [Akkermansiaceae bacterium]
MRLRRGPSWQLKDESVTEETVELVPKGIVE